MSSTIKLYEHNQKAYDALLDMLGERDRACVIKPTGTGKFVIIAKMVQDNPDKRFLLLGTNDYMFNDQMANLTEIAPGFTPENLQFMTYSAAMMAARRGEEISSYDVVVADEFHHCGAEEWGKGVTHILDANESAKVVGFSATPIRYSDGGRNMADEMFDGNVAYSMELEEAWLRGILPIPKYVTAFYEAPKELGRLAKSIDGIKDEMVMKRFQKKYENLRRSLTEAGGVREAIAKHLKKRDAKVIVFCPRVAKLREFMLLRREWFGAVNSEIHAYKTVSADPYGSEDFQAFKDDKSDALKVLYCVNQLNEAVHVKGVDAIVMVRPTKSPTVFYQQLGRVLSSGGNRTPLVFDFCNNFGSIVVAERIPKRMEETFKRLTGESEQLPFTPSDFRIIDRTLTFRQLTDEIRKSLGVNSICFDTETTGLHPNGSDPDEILTISIIGRDGSVLLDERFRPTVKTEWPHASAVNGIYPEDVADLPTIETAIPRLREIFAGADEVIGYNVGFDLGFLSAVGVRPREDARITDTMKEFTWFMGRRYKLVDAADHIGYEWTGRAHGSLADALATLAVQRWLEQWLVAE